MLELHTQCDTHCLQPLTGKRVLLPDFWYNPQNKSLRKYHFSFPRVLPLLPRWPGSPITSSPTTDLCQLCYLRKANLTSEEFAQNSGFVFGGIMAKYLGKHPSVPLANFFLTLCMHVPNTIYCHQKFERPSVNRAIFLSASQLYLALAVLSIIVNTYQQK